MITWITLAAAVIAALASAFTAWRQWANWHGGQRNDRFERAVDRALSSDARTSSTGLHQVTGMYRRGELSNSDTAYMRDTIQGILDLSGLPADLDVVADTDTPEDDGYEDPS